MSEGTRGWRDTILEPNLTEGVGAAAPILTGAAADFDDFDRGRRGRSVLTRLILTNFDRGPKKWPVLTYYHPMGEVWLVTVPRVAPSFRRVVLLLISSLPLYTLVIVILETQHTQHAQHTPACTARAPRAR